MISVPIQVALMVESRRSQENLVLLESTPSAVGLVAARPTESSQVRQHTKDRQVHHQVGGGEREREKERENELLYFPGVILAWIWDGSGAFSK